MKFRDPHFFVAGHAVLDEIFQSKKQRTPRRALGGAVCYGSVAVKSLGYQPRIITRIGENFPQRHVDYLLAHTGVNFAKSAKRGVETTRYKIDTTGDCRNLWLLEKSDDLDYEDFAKATNDFRETGFLILNPVAGEVSLDLLSKISCKFKRVFADSQGFVRSYDPKSGRVSSKVIADCSCLSGVFALKADREELCCWTGIRNMNRAIDKLSDYVENILITSGKGPVELYKKGKSAFRTIPLQVNVKDTTGAGDIMLAAFAVRYSETGSLSQAVEFATTASSLATQELGVNKAVLSRNGILSKLAKVAQSNYS